MALPNECQTIANQISQIEQRMRNIDKAIAALEELNGNDEEPIKPSKDPEYQELKRERRQLTSQRNQLNAKLNQCLIRHLKPAPMRLSVESMTAFDGDDPLSNDEPYLLIFVLDLPSMANPATAKYKAVDLFWSSVADNRKPHCVPPNTLWGVTGVPAVIREPDDVIVLVALAEHDASALGNLESSLGSTLGDVLQRQSAEPERSRLVRSLRILMGVWMVQAVLIDPYENDDDDQIGPVTELRLSKLDLARAFHYGSTQIHLDFKSSSASYRVTFLLQHC